MAKRFVPTIEQGLLLLLALFGIASAWGSAARFEGVDFYQYWVVGQSYGHSSLNAYSAKARAAWGAEFLNKAKASGSSKELSAAQDRANLETYSSPFLYELFGLASSGNYDADWRHYRLLALGSFVLGVLLLSRLAHPSWNVALGAIALFSSWFEPLASDLRVGNVNSLQLAALAVSLWILVRWRWAWRDLLAGAVMGIAVAFKPTLVFAAALLAVALWIGADFKRGLKYAAGLLTGLFAAIVPAAAAFGNLRSWLDWMAALRAMPGAIITVDMGNFSLARLLEPALGSHADIILFVVLGGLAVAALLMRRREGPEGVAWTAASIGGLLTVLVSRLAWFHYYVLTIPAFLFLLKPGNVGAPEKNRFRYSVPILCLPVFATHAMFSVGIPLTARAQGILAVAASLALYVACGMPQLSEAIGRSPR